MRGLVAATQFLTRLPVPRLRAFDTTDLSRSAKWFPIVGAVVGACVSALCIAGALIDPWLGGLLGTIAWIWITGALHLDGLADLADALGAAHADEDRFLEVLRDPHLGVFGATTLFLAIASKIVLLYLLLADLEHAAEVLILICAWSRLGPLAWSRWLKPLTSGSGERFAWQVDSSSVIVWTLVLIALSLWLAPSLLIAPFLIAMWALYLHYRIGGMTGDCLGVGVEIVETALLLTAVVAQSTIGISM
jgi:adenosylcobinamide-GDP ribazoletransferase